MSDQLERNPFEDADTPLELLAMLAGAASVCWADVDKAGVFMSGRAEELVDAALERLIALGWSAPPAHVHDASCAFGNPTCPAFGEG